MTVIVWDGYTLAADTQAHGGSSIREVPKVFKLEDGRLFGACGTNEQTLEVVDYLNGKTTAKPELKEEEFFGIIIKDHVAYRVEHKLIPSKIRENTHAIGSGGDYARAALYLGKSAREAVQIAIDLDPNCGGSVEGFECYHQPWEDSPIITRAPLPPPLAPFHYPCASPARYDDEMPF